MSDVTIVIPNYNGIAFLKTCLDSVLAQTGVQMDVIIIDNGSVDGSQEFISSNYPQCELVCLDQNYGFCRAVNEGINRAKSPYVILLNNDTEVRPLFCCQSGSIYEGGQEPIFLQCTHVDVHEERSSG